MASKAIQTPNLDSQSKPKPTHDRSTTLCLACSSSLPPFKSTSSSEFNANANEIYTTNCCRRPICPSCIVANPRLARYDPCLACLGGVGVVASGSGSVAGYGLGAATPMKGLMSPTLNIDGAVRDEDTFVLGDDEDDEEAGVGDDGKEEGYREVTAGVEAETVSVPPPAYESVPAVVNSTEEEESTTIDEDVPAADKPPSATQDESTKSKPYKYYINRADTLQGIALRFGLDSHEICRMNNLPPSAIRTTPHLLHTRAFLLLPPTAKPHPSLTLGAAEEHKREEQLVRERAEKKLQTLTKEVDWRVAKAYVALADDAHEQAVYSFKKKEIGGGAYSGACGSMGMEALAVQRYLDDEEWEAEERRAGRGVQLQKFPYGEFGTDWERKRSQTAQPSGSGWWWERKWN